MGKVNPFDVEDLHIEKMKLDYLGKGALSQLRNVVNIYASENALKEIDKKLFSKDNAKASKMVRSLDLSNNQLSGSSFAFLKQFRNVTILKISDNKLPVIPKSLSLVGTSLKELILINNVIEELSFEVELPNLETLVVSNNQITRLDSNVFKKLPNLKKLTASKNAICDISGLASCCRLEEVRLSRNKLEHLDFEALAPSTNLRVLDLSSNEIASFSNDESMAKCTQLESINFSRNPFCASLFSKRIAYHAYFINKVFQNCTNLVNFDSNAVAELRSTITRRERESGIELHSEYRDPSKTAKSSALSSGKSKPQEIKTTTIDENEANDSEELDHLQDEYVVIEEKQPKKKKRKTEVEAEDKRTVWAIKPNVSGW